MQTNHKTVSIILVTHNSCPALRSSLTGLKRGLGEISYEIIVVDNDSHDDSLSCARELFPSVRVIENKHNEGFARGCNQGAAVAVGDYLLFHNPDLEIDEGAVEGMLRGVLCKRAGWRGGRADAFPGRVFSAYLQEFSDMAKCHILAGISLLAVVRANTKLYS